MANGYKHAYQVLQYFNKSGVSLNPLQQYMLALGDGADPGRVYPDGATQLVIDTVATLGIGALAKVSARLAGAGFAKLAAATGARTAEDAAAALVQRAAQKVSDQGVERLLKSLSPAERGAYQGNPVGGSRFLGQAVHRAARDELDVQFKGRFNYFTRGPDFYDNYTRAYVELTTPASVAAHLARPGYEGVAYALYTLP